MATTAVIEIRAYVAKDPRNSCGRFFCFVWLLSGAFEEVAVHAANHGRQFRGTTTGTPGRYWPGSGDMTRALYKEQDGLLSIEWNLDES